MELSCTAKGRILDFIKNDQRQTWNSVCNSNDELGSTHAVIS